MTALLCVVLALLILARQVWRECRPDPETLTREERDHLADLAWEALMRDVRVQLDAAAEERVLTGVRLQRQRGVSVYVVAPDELLTQESRN